MKQLLLSLLIISFQGIVAQETITVRKTEEIYQFVEQMPEFPGSQSNLYEFIGRNLVYPDSLKKNGIQGKVYVSFVVEKDGSISNIETLRSPHPALREESERVVRLMPNWIPGMQEGKAVRVKFVLPINFRLR